MISKTTLLSVVAYLTDKAQAAVDSLTNAAASIARDSKTLLTTKLTASFVAGTAADEFVALGYFRAGADIVWQNITAVVDANTTGLEGELGFLDDAGVFTKVATMATHSGNVCSVTLEPYADTELTDNAYLVIKLKGTPPVSGSAAFYVPYITLA